MHDLIQTWLNEPQITDTPRRTWRDWALVAVVWIVTGFELLVRNDLHSPWAAAPFVMLLAFTLLFRRSHPFEAAALNFGGILLFDIAFEAAGYEELNFFSAAFLLIPMYTLFRWGSGRQMAIGSALGIALMIASNVFAYTGIGDVIAGAIVLEFPAVTGYAVRTVTRSRQQNKEQIRMNERERLARELHDTVAHHMSAIAIQAQAGRFVAESGSLEGAADALAIIEEEASRTLSEMRSIVGSLRETDAPAEMAPLHGVAEISDLATTMGEPVVEVVLGEGVSTVAPTLGAALYRIAQESVTNARRHARNATKVVVHVVALGDQVQLTVTDDGDRPAKPNENGFGLIGMTERATLLGGSLEAGPDLTRGWQVRASLPREKQPQ